MSDDPSNALMRNCDRLKICVGFGLQIWTNPDENLSISLRLFRAICHIDFANHGRNHLYNSRNEVSVVTGANKGIGLEICRQLASNGITVILTARDEIKGARAVEALKISRPTDVIFHQLDVNDATSVTSLAGFIKTRYGKLDILVNNAGDNGVRLKISEEAMKDLNFQFGDEKDEIAKLLEESIEDTYERAKQSIETTYYGTKRVTEALLPLLQLSNSARIVNVSSVYGQLKFISNETIKEELRNVDCLTVEKIYELMHKFLKDFKDGMLETNGWPVLISAYKVSKAAITAYTRILARKFPSLCVNAVHPGLVKTDISFHQGNLTPDEGAKAPVMVALLPSDGPSGFYFDQMEISTF